MQKKGVLSKPKKIEISPYDFVHNDEIKKEITLFLTLDHIKKMLDLACRLSLQTFVIWRNSCETNC